MQFVNGRVDPKCFYINIPIFNFLEFSFPSYLKEELVQSTRKQQEDSGAEDQGPFNNRVYTFVTVPQHFESVSSTFVAYGILQCLDHLLVIYTFLPIRCTLTVLKLIFSWFRNLLLFPLKTVTRAPPSMGNPDDRLLYSHEIRDWIRFSLLIICTVVLVQIDTSVIYHEIRTQSVVKIYIFFNLLEVADRLLSAVCQDALDDLLYTASRLRHTPIRLSTIKIAPSPTHVSEGAVALMRDLVLQYGFALICLFAHCFLLLCQVTTLNVAFNSQNKSLVTVFISNNFVELKGNVFRKMGKTNLFQIACADVRERFHYAIWLLIVVCRNMTDTGWNCDDLWEMLYDVICILLAEVAVDWVYKEYTVSIAYDLLLCRQGKFISWCNRFLFPPTFISDENMAQNKADFFDLLSRRMGLTPIPLGCLINVMLLQTVRNPSYLLFALPFALIVLFPIKILVNMTLLSLAYSRVKAYIKAESAAQVNEIIGKSEDLKTVDNVKQHEAEPRRNKQDNGEIPLNTKHEMQPAIHSTPMRLLGFDQPTRDDDQFVPMVLRYRRVRSDSELASSPTPIPPTFESETSNNTVQDNALQRLERPTSAVSIPVLEPSLFAASSEFLSPESKMNDDHVIHEQINGECFEFENTRWSSDHSILNESEVSLSEFVPPFDSSKDGSETRNPSSGRVLLSKEGKLGPDIEVRPSSKLDHEPQTQFSQLRVMSSLEPKGTSSQLSCEGLPVAAIDTNGANCHTRTVQFGPFRMRTRCYSIDLGVLSGFTRQLLQSDPDLGLKSSQSPGQLNSNQDIASVHQDKSSQTETFVRRRRKRTRTECSDQQNNIRISEVDGLPALWQRSSRNSVVQPFNIARLMVKQPLSDVDRYSMIEGQIS
ncbi:Membrane proteinTapt1 CMV receptor [Fasciola gigantica]|uniref:Membrane proteinTapt1 CMV receptor n=1 Tax=Fasciola gigantica TaxID=46835 RepID=A0A504YTV1_FASGI|nr:Membrane proteinTapt1 CMV receptor [Fasciola gigantica]